MRLLRLQVNVCERYAAAGNDSKPRSVPHRRSNPILARAAVHDLEYKEDWAMATVIKDAGDDPDVTHGALIRATVRHAAPGSGITFRAGEGVGMVTRPGLPLPPGEPAINPVPRQMMRDTIAEAAAKLFVEQDYRIGASGDRPVVHELFGRCGGLMTLEDLPGVLELQGRSGAPNHFKKEIHSDREIRAIEQPSLTGFHHHAQARNMVIPTSGSDHQILSGTNAGFSITNHGRWHREIDHCIERRKEVRRQRLSIRIVELVQSCDVMASFCSKLRYKRARFAFAEDKQVHKQLNRRVR